MHQSASQLLSATRDMIRYTAVSDATNRCLDNIANRADIVRFSQFPQYKSPEFLAP